MRWMCVVGVVGLGSAGCERDPSFFGVWDVARVERDGVVQPDAGVLEVLGDGSLAMVLRYAWTGSDFVPDPRPTVVLGDTSQEGVELGEGYKEKGETYELLLTPFGETPFAVDEYTGARARLSCEVAAWPDRPEDLRPTVLVLTR